MTYILAFLIGFMVVVKIVEIFTNLKMEVLQ